MAELPHCVGMDRDAYRHSPAVTIRWATAADARSLRWLAELEQAPVPAAPVLLAFVGDELWAAASVSGGGVISDPFKPSAEVVSLLRERGRQLTVPRRERPRSALRHLRLGRQTG